MEAVRSQRMAQERKVVDVDYLPRTFAAWMEGAAESGKA